MRCPRCGALLSAEQRQCGACFYVLAAAGHQPAPAADLEEYQTTRLALKQDFEVRYERTVPTPIGQSQWYRHDRATGSHGTPGGVSHSQWTVIARTRSRIDALIIGEALHRQRGWRIEIWDLDPTHPERGTQQRTDCVPDVSVRPCDCRFCIEERQRGVR